MRNYIAAVVVAGLWIGLQYLGMPYITQVHLGFLLAGVGLVAFVYGRGPALLTFGLTTVSILPLPHATPVEILVYAVAAVVVAVLVPSVQARLQSSEQRFRLLAENAHTLIWTSDPEKNLTYANPQWVGFTGSREGSWLEKVHPEDRAPCTAQYDRALLSLQPFSHEFRLQRQDGSYRTVLDHAAPYWDRASKVLGYISTGVDVSELRRATARYRQASKMEALGRLSSGVAHDFNNIIGVIGVLNDLALEDIDSQRPVSRSDLVQIRSATRRARDLTAQLALFGRKEQPDISEVNLNKTIQDVIRLTRNVLKDNVVLGGTLSPSLGPVAAEPTLVEQVFMNLILNARDAMPDGGTLLIETKNILVRTPLDLPLGPYAMVVVSDNGCGIPAELLSQIFEPFFTTKPPDVGSGLGLSTVFSIMQQLGGSIEVASTVGQGTSFTLLFPQSDGVVEEVRPVLAGTETILVVDDDDTIRGLVHRMLTTAGYRVVDVDSGKQALAIIGQQPVHLVITDILMPGMDGEELSRYLQKQYADLPVIFMSGYTDQKIVAADRFLQKPFTSAALLQLVREVFQGRGSGPVYSDLA